MGGVAILGLALVTSTVAAIVTSAAGDDGSALDVLNVLALPLGVRDLVFLGHIGPDSGLSGVDGGGIPAVGGYLVVLKRAGAAVPPLPRGRPVTAPSDEAAAPAVPPPPPPPAPTGTPSSPARRFGGGRGGDRSRAPSPPAAGPATAGPTAVATASAADPALVADATVTVQRASVWFGHKVALWSCRARSVQASPGLESQRRRQDHADAGHDGAAAP